MRSVYAKILLSSLAVLAFSFLSFLVIARSNSFKNFRNGGVFGGLLDEQSSGAEREFTRGGRAALSVYLNSIARQYPGTQRFYLDLNGRDVLTGIDRAKDLTDARSWWSRFNLLGPIYVAQPAIGGKHILLFTPSTSNVIKNLQLYYILLFAAIVVLCWMLGLQFVSA